LGGIELWVDAAFANADAALALRAELAPHADRIVPVIASESLASRAALEDCHRRFGPQGAVLSLDRRLKRPWTLLTGCLALALVTGALNYIHHPDHSFYPVDLGFAFGQTTNYVYVWHYTVLNLLFAATILVLVSVHTQDKPSALRRLWENKWLVGIGKVSYGMYIYHWMIWYYLFEGVFKPVGVKWRVPLFIPFVIVVYIVASLSFKYFESFFIRLKDRLYPTRGKGGKKEGETPSLPNLKTPLEYE